jgi:NAD(P)-dependent dehydrogenase (short-subunit alcohol dehydrogenase family)
MGELTDKVALVTSASTGIGHAVATRYAAEGETVFFAGGRQPELHGSVAAVEG